MVLPQRDSPTIAKAFCTHASLRCVAIHRTKSETRGRQIKPCLFAIESSTRSSQRALTADSVSARKGSPNKLKKARVRTMGCGRQEARRGAISRISRPSRSRLPQSRSATPAAARRARGKTSRAFDHDDDGDASRKKQTAAKSRSAAVRAEGCAHANAPQRLRGDEEFAAATSVRGRHAPPQEAGM